MLQTCWEFLIHMEREIPLYRKSMGKHKHSKVKDSSNISREAVIYAIHKTWNNWILGKQKYSKIMSFYLKYFTWSRKSFYSQNMGWVISCITEKVCQNTGNAQVLLYLTKLMKTYTIPNIWQSTNSYHMEMFYWKPYHYQTVIFWGN